MIFTVSASKRKVVFQGGQEAIFLFQQDLVRKKKISCIIKAILKESYENNSPLIRYETRSVGEQGWGFLHTRKPFLAPVLWLSGPEI